MSLLTWQETRPWARAVKDRVVTRQMPHWHAERGVGEYTADPSLSGEEIATVAAWVDAGAPRGNPADAPPPLDLANLNEWTYGEPDLVVQMKEGFRTDDNTLNGVALLSIPSHSVVRHERFWPLPQAALILSFQPH